MSRVFAYCRVSTAEQTTDNQVIEIRAAGFNIDPRRVVAERVSGSVAAKQRAGFAKLLDRLEEGDVLIVTKLDRLGRNAMDVRATVDELAAVGVRVHCLALGGADLTSAAGKMTMTVLSAVAEFERDLLLERTAAGLARARETGKVLGRPKALSEKQEALALSRLASGAVGGRHRPRDEYEPPDHHAAAGARRCDQRELRVACGSELLGRRDRSAWSHRPPFVLSVLCSAGAQFVVLATATVADLVGQIGRSVSSVLQPVSK